VPSRPLTILSTLSLLGLGVALTAMRPFRNPVLFSWGSNSTRGFLVAAGDRRLCVIRQDDFKKLGGSTTKAAFFEVTSRTELWPLYVRRASVMAGRQAYGTVTEVGLVGRHLPGVRLRPSCHARALPGVRDPRACDRQRFRMTGARPFFNKGTPVDARCARTASRYTVRA
jgi:hypothetical protein